MVPAIFASTIIRKVLRDFRERTLENAEKFAEEVLSNGYSSSSTDEDRSDSGDSAEGDDELEDTAADNVRPQSPESGPGLSPMNFEETRGQIQPTLQRIFNTHSPACGSDSSSSTSRANETVGKAAPSVALPHGGKRKRNITSSTSNGGDEENDDEDDRPVRKRPDQSLEIPEVTCGKKFACPFFKRRPVRSPKARACVYPGFSNIARMK